MFVLDGAFCGMFALRVAGEESAMIFFEVGVVVGPGGEHKVDVELKPFVGVVGSVALGEGDKLSCELVVQGVFTGF